MINEETLVSLTYIFTVLLGKGFHTKIALKSPFPIRKKTLAHNCRNYQEATLNSQREILSLV